MTIFPSEDPVRKMDDSPTPQSQSIVPLHLTEVVDVRQSIEARNFEAADTPPLEAMAPQPTNNEAILQQIN